MRYLLYILVLLLASCTSDLLDCTNSSGPLDEYVISPGQFLEVRLKDNIDATWHKSDSTYLVLRCGKNLKDKIRIENDGTLLTISNQNKCNWIRSYDMTMHVDLFSPSPRLIWLDGFGDFKTADTISRDLNIKHYGASKAEILVKTTNFGVDFNSPGHINMYGTCLRSFYYVQNFGKFNALELEADTCWLHMDGQNDVKIWATQKLEGEYIGGRTVYLKGKPVIDVTMKGTGKIAAWK